MQSPLRGVFFAALCFTIGLLFSQYGPVHWIRLLISIIVMITLVLLIFTRRFSNLRVFFIALLWVSIGWTRATPKTEVILPDSRVWVFADVLSPIEKYENKRRVRLKLNRWEAGSRCQKLNGKAIAYIDEQYHVNPGDRVKIAGRVDIISTTRNPGDYNARAYWGARGVEYRISQIRDVEKLERGVFSNYYFSSIFKIRSHVNNLIDKHCESERAHLVRALMIGDRSGWDEDTREQFANSGLMHLFAISGFHVGLLALIIGAFFSPLGPQKSKIIVLFVIWLYVPVTSANPPVVRATIMLTFYIFGKLLNRKSSTLYSLILSYLFLLAIHPISLYTPGFQLSFAGAAGSIFAAKKYQSLVYTGSLKKFKPLKRIMMKYGSRVLYLLLISIYAFASSAPFVVFHFGRIPWFGPFLTIFAIPILLLILASGWLMVIFSFFPWLSAVFAASMSGWVGIIEKLSFFSVNNLFFTDNLSIFVVIPLSIAAVILFSISGRIKTAPLASLVLYIFICLNLGLYSQFFISDQKIKAAIVDVGQGDGILLKKGSRTVLIDGGRGENKAILRQLRNLGIKKLDLMFISHGDADHCGNSSKIMEKHELGVLICGPQIWRDSTANVAIETALEKNIPVVVGKRGMKIYLGEMGNISIICPGNVDTSLSDNDLSLVMIWEVEGNRLLFPGDASSRIESELLSGDFVDDCDFLMVAHHGSKHSTSLEWLDRVKPEIAAISCGVNNPYGHPAKEVLDRIEKYDSKIYRTDEEGFLLFIIQKGIINKARWWEWY